MQLLVLLTLLVIPCVRAAPRLRPLPSEALERLRGAEARPVVNGEETSEYLAVGALLVVDSRNYGGVMCSGTLVDPTHVVTAAHCAHALETDYAAWTAYFAVGADVMSEEGPLEWARVTSIHAHPSYDDRTLDNDIGVLELGRAMAEAEPLAVNRERMTAAWVGRELRYLGFGVTDDGLVDAGVKRFADLPIYSVDTMFVYAYDPDDGQNLCSGDSGGAGLEDLGRGAFELAVVNSFVWSPDGDGSPCRGGATGGIRVDRFTDWISTWADLHDGSGDPFDTGSGDTGEKSTQPFRPREEGGGWCATLPPAHAAPWVPLAMLASFLRRRRP